jgi:hypothetical protein
MTPDQLQRLITAINDRYAHIAAQMQSADYRPDLEQLQRWQRLGLVPEDVTPETFMLSVPAEMHLIRNAFILGRLAEAVERGESFDAVIRAAVSMPLLKPDLEAIAVAEQQAGVYIRNFGADVATEAGKLWAQKQGEMVRNMAIEFHNRTLPATVLDVGQKAEAGLPVPEKTVSTWQQFASELHHVMDDKARDWQRVAYTELTDTAKQGGAHRLLEQYGSDALVYKVPMATACAQCKHAYLLADGKTPRIFKLEALLRNGNNVGRKANPVRGGKVVPGGRPDGEETVKPVAGTMHPFCQCGGVYKITGHEPWLTEKQKGIIRGLKRKAVTSDL